MSSLSIRVEDLEQELLNLMRDNRNIILQLNGSTQSGRTLAVFLCSDDACGMVETINEFVLVITGDIEIAEKFKALEEFTGKCYRGIEGQSRTWSMHSDLVDA